MQSKFTTSISLYPASLQPLNDYLSTGAHELYPLFRPIQARNYLVPHQCTATLRVAELPKTYEYYFAVCVLQPILSQLFLFALLIRAQTEIHTQYRKFHPLCLLHFLCQAAVYQFDLISDYRVALLVNVATVVDHSAIRRDVRPAVLVYERCERVDVSLTGTLQLERTRSRVGKPITLICQPSVRCTSVSKATTATHDSPL